MTSIAELGIKVDSTDAAQASTDLDKLTAAGGRAEKAAEGLARGADKATASMKKQKDELSDLLGEIDPAVKALGRLDDLETKLAKQKKLGALDASTFSEYQGKIDQSRANLGRFDDSLTRTGNTAKQTAAALRGVPAQFTDIAVSLQGGQAPLTVLLQQGGQLKDMFGGIAPAAKALGGYVLGLINPFTLAAAAVAALGLAYYKGSEEADAYNEALILSGNVAGTSASQLSDMARQVSATVGTTGAAAEVLAKLAGNGKIASDSFGQITEAALQMEKATGRAIDETIAEFAKIAKDPVAAAKELNDQYHFLTASIYSQIVALKEQGDTVGAAKLLTDSYASTIETRTGEITQNLGIIERGWNAVRDAAKGALDATKEIGRTQSLEQQAEVIRQRLKTGQGRGGRAAAMGIETRDTARDTRDLAFLELQIEAEKTRTKYLGDRQKVQDKGIEAERELERIRVASYSNKQKRDKEEEAYLRKVANLREANPNSPLLDQKNIDRDLKNIRDKYKDPKGASGSVDLTSFNSAKNNLSDIVNDYRNAQKELDAEQKRGAVSLSDYSKQRSALIKQEKDDVTAAYQAEIDALEAAKSKKGTTAAQSIQIDQKIADARQGMIKAQKDADSQLKVLSSNEEGRLRQLTVASEAYVEQLERQRRALSLTGDRNAAAVGMGDRESGLQRDLDASRDKFNDERAKLLDRRKTAPDKYSQDDYESDLASLQDAEIKYRDTVVENYGKMSEAQGDWRKGATSAYHNYLESARDVAGQTRSLFTNAFSSMEDAVANFAVTSKLSFSDFTKSIIADMARIATRQAASGLLSSIAGTALGAWLGGGGGGGATSFGSDIGGAITANAKGGVYDSPSLSSFSNQVHDKPQMFAFAKGAGIFAEAGPEAIMPLTRTAGGELGVRALGGGGGGASGGNTESKMEVTININRDGSGDATADTAMGQKLAPQFLAMIRGEIAANERRTLSPSGGATWRAINGR